MSTIENLDKTNLMKSMGNYDETLYLRSLARFLALSFYFRFFFFSIVRDASHVYWQQGQHEPLTHTHIDTIAFRIDYNDFSFGTTYKTTPFH